MSLVPSWQDTPGGSQSKREAGPGFPEAITSVQALKSQQAVWNLVHRLLGSELAVLREVCRDV